MRSQTRPTNSKGKLKMKKLSITFATILLVLVYCAFLPKAQAVTPAPDGGYPGNNTAEGDGALFSLTTGSNNAAIGFDALFSNTTGSSNTANGINALYFNNADNNTATGAGALVWNT